MAASPELERRRLIARTRSEADGRRSHLTLTAAGRAAFAPLGARSHDEAAALLAARRIYEAAGYRLTHTERHTSVGRDLVGETWEKPL